MAKLIADQFIKNDVWYIVWYNDPDALSVSDIEAMKKFGEPSISLGGTFLEGEEEEFEVPDRYVKIRSDFPVTTYFDSTSPPFDTDTQVKVLAYRDEIVDRFTTALTELRNNADTFTGQNVYDI